MHIHLIAVAGTGMGSLAGMLKSAGHEVTGSDVAFHPPMGPLLRTWEIGLMEGFDPAHLEPAPDLVVVGNVCRPDNPEARAAIDGGLNVTTMVDALADHVLAGTSPLVVGGTHGKTTTSSMCAWLLTHGGLSPGFLIGGKPKNFERSYQLPPRPAVGRLPLANPIGSARKVPFVIEGDEYDTAFFEKTPKFWHYQPEVAIISSIEHDHIDIYPDEASYLAAFQGFIERVPQHGLIVANAADAQIVALVQAHAQSDVAWYALAEDPLPVAPHWVAAPAQQTADGQSFDLFAGGVMCGRGALALSGKHNLRNAVAAIGAACQGFGMTVTSALSGLTEFAGVARRQDLIGTPRGIQVYEDFAHHPTAISETLRGLRARHPSGKLWAVYEPRTATACRDLHQAAYEVAFDAADHVLFAPLGRSNIPQHERLDLEALVGVLEKRGVAAATTPSIDAIVTQLAAEAEPDDTIALLSNGAFGGIYSKLLATLDTQEKKSGVNPPRLNIPDRHNR